MPARFTYLQARILLLILGVVLGVVQAGLAWDRGAAPTEVLAPLLVIPVFIGAIFWFLAGGLVAAGLVSVIYGVLLFEQTTVVGLGTFSQLLVLRVLSYVFFAVVVALGVRYIEGRLRKLEIYDQVDDRTGVYNSAFFLEDTDLEMSRANRYQSIFSVITLDVDREAFQDLPRRRRRRVLRELARRVESSVRTVDRVAYADDGRRDRFLLVLPETGPEGAAVFTARLHAAVGEFLSERGCRVDGHMRTGSLTYPEDQPALAELRDEVAELEAARRSIREQSER